MLNPPLPIRRRISTETTLATTLLLLFYASLVGDSFWKFLAIFLKFSLYPPTFHRWKWKDVEINVQKRRRKIPKTGPRGDYWAP